MKRSERDVKIFKGNKSNCNCADQLEEKLYYDTIAVESNIIHCIHYKE